MGMAGVEQQQGQRAGVRERLSMEFITADSEVTAFKALLKGAEVLPQLSILDSTAPEPHARSGESFDSNEPCESNEPCDSNESNPESNESDPESNEYSPVDELMMLFGSI